MSNKWTTEEVELLKKHFPSSTMDQLLEMFPGRSEMSIKTKAAKLGLSRTPETRSLIASISNKERNTKAWSEEEIEILKKYYTTHGPQWIHDNHLPDRSVSSIRVKANSLGKEASREANWIREEEVIKENGLTRTIQVVYKRLN